MAESGGNGSGNGLFCRGSQCGIRPRFPEVAQSRYTKNIQGEFSPMVKNPLICCYIFCSILDII
jgi:hypothetical protein